MVIILAIIHDGHHELATEYGVLKRECKTPRSTGKEEMTMKIEGSVALVTGANRGLGLAFAQGLLARGASKVYAAVRDPESVKLQGVVPIKLDVSSDDDAVAAARVATDVTLVVNNAGIALAGNLLADGAIENARKQFEVNVLGPLRVSRAFAPVLAANGGGALVNVLSVASWRGAPILSTYGVSKAAAWSVTNGLRMELEAQRTQVLGLHVGFIDTDLMRGLDAPKLAPEDVVTAALDGLERGELQVLADDKTRAVHCGLSDAHSSYLGVAPKEE